VPLLQVAAVASHEPQMLLKTTRAAVQPMMQPRHRTAADRGARSQPLLAVRRLSGLRPSANLQRQFDGLGRLSELGFELVQFACPFAELGVGRAFADAGYGPADGFCAVGRDARGNQHVQRP